MKAVLTLHESELNQSLAALQSELAATKAINFCTAWPVAKPVLNVIGNAIPAARWIIAALITIGDAYFAKHCSAPGKAS